MRVTFWMDEDILNAGKIQGELGKIYELMWGKDSRTEQLNSKKYFYDRL